jgi:hypothetical protein
MSNQWRVGFTVYLNDAMTETQSDLTNLETVVTAFQPSQAEAMVRAQYNNRAHIWYCRPAEWA